MRGTVIFIIGFALCWLAIAAFQGWRDRQKPDPFDNPFGDVPGRGR